MEKSFANYPSLRGKNILITGGASGIGKELVKAFAEQESNVAFLDLNAVAGEELCLDIGEDVFFEECDLREVDKLKSSIEKLRSKLGLFDVLVNNAAHDDRHKWQDVTEEYWDERFATNLRHHFFTIQSVAKDMIEKGLIEEVEKILDHKNISRNSQSMKSVGYRQVCDFLEGDIDLDDMIEKGINATRQLAKRQMTWINSWKDLIILENNAELSTSVKRIIE